MSIFNLCGGRPCQRTALGCAADFCPFKEERMRAAAPDLYEALVLLFAHTEGAIAGDARNDEIFAKARAALNKVAPSPYLPAGTADQ